MTSAIRHSATTISFSGCSATPAAPLFGLLGERGLALPGAQAVVSAHRAAHPAADADRDAAAARYDEDRDALSHLIKNIRIKFFV